MSSLVACRVVAGLQPHQVLGLARVLAGGRAAGIRCSAVVGALGAREAAAGTEAFCSW